MRLIDAEELYLNIVEKGQSSKRYKIGEFWELNGAELRDVIDNQPTVDAAPVRLGKWQITEAYPHNVYCSECHKKFAQTHWAVFEDGSLPRNFCPNCGARMD